MPFIVLFFIKYFPWGNLVLLKNEGISIQMVKHVVSQRFYQLIELNKKCVKLQIRAQKPI